MQVYNWTGNLPPFTPFQNANFTNQLYSGPPRSSSPTFRWSVGSHYSGYRPGSYFFVDENNPAGGIVAIGLTYEESDNLFPPQPCSRLASGGAFYDGRYASYASRPGCTFYQVNNYQTEAHFDWVAPVFAMEHGDLVIFQWSNEHNVVQVHDVTSDVAIPGGIHSGPKRNCVPGPRWQCINQPQESAEYLFDSTNHRPGMVHISDECAYTCTGHTTGMNMQFFIQRIDDQRPPPPQPSSCCQFDPTKGIDCRVIEIYNDEEGMQFNYNISAGSKDLVRFRWAGSLQIYQSTAAASNNAPTSTPLPGGEGMLRAVECIPGPNWSCLGINYPVEWIFDIEKALAEGRYIDTGFGNRQINFYALGENTEGFTSQNTGTIIWIDRSVSYNGNRSAVACSSLSSSSSSGVSVTTSPAASSTSASSASSTSSTVSSSSAFTSSANTGTAGTVSLAYSVTRGTCCIVIPLIITSLTTFIAII
eukprot:TRINITY_DN7560_c0_g2_i1.p1 TRINITY_DN7560_c0_g2~~TRINITY_DN7560_c0_g2_i1.p1  ORF type:complete len:475 (-),score=59.74 TRINITY_DN7560_c0_g2_i1:40-1464(-)